MMSASASDIVRAAELAWDIYRMGWGEELNASKWSLFVTLREIHTVKMLVLHLFTPTRPELEMLARLA